MPKPPLTDRQQECVALLAEGLTYRQIAKRRGISVSAVRSHLVRAYRKLGASNGAEAVAALHPEPLRDRRDALKAEIAQLRGELEPARLYLRAFDAHLIGMPRAREAMSAALEAMHAERGLEVPEPQAGRDRDLLREVFGRG